MKIIMTSFRILPPKQPAADFIRFTKLSSFLSEKNQVIFISPNNKFKLEKNTYMGKTNYKLPTFGNGYLRVLSLYFLSPFYIQKIIKEVRPNVVFINSFFYSKCLSTFRNSKIKIHLDVMGIEHREWLKKRGNKLVKLILACLIRNNELNLYKKADFITTVNFSHKKVLQRFTNKPVYVLRDGVDEYMKNSKAIYRKEEKSTKLIFVGSIVKRRLDGLFDCLDEVFKNTTDLKIVIIGEGEDKKYYESIARKNNWLGDKIQFLGYVEHDKIFGFINKADICFSDDWSKIGFPTKVFEYMLLAKPIVVEGTEAVREVIHDGANGVLYKNKKELSTAIIKLYSNKSFRKKIAKRAYVDVKKNHLWSIRKRELVQIYKSISR